MKNYVGEVELIQPPAENTEESISKYLGECAGVVRDKSIKNPSKLLHRLMTEAYGGTPSRVLEYIPCKISYSRVLKKFDHAQLSRTFGFYGEGYYYTNARELMNWGWDWENVIEYINFENYKVIHCVAPYFVYGQLSTHTQITSVSHSQRFAKSDRGYWYPREYEEYITDDEISKDEAQHFWNETVMLTYPLKLQEFMKTDLRIKRREVWARGADMLQYRPFTLGGYTNDPQQWEWFINQRTKDSHAQKETRDFVGMVQKVIEERQK